jgi:predicted DNA-binding transcriptional regulator YafY
VRAYCHTREKFLDFVIARMLSIEETGTSGVSGRDDAVWHNVVTLVLGPNPNLSPGGQRVIELDYGMTEGVVRLECRQALLFYTLKCLGLSKKDVVEPPETQQIILKNASEITQYLGTSGD